MSPGSALLLPKAPPCDIVMAQGSEGWRSLDLGTHGTRVVVPPPPHSSGASE